MLYGYVRVSTDLQTTENQLHSLMQYKDPDTQEFIPEKNIVQETISSRVPIEKRRISEFLTKLQPKDTLVVPELSRLGRSLVEVLNLIDVLTKKDVKIVSLKEGYTITSDIQSKIFSTILSLVAELERDIISKRTKEALNRLKTKGVKLGRPHTTNGKKRLNLFKKNFLHDLNERFTLDELSDKYGISRSTAARYRKILREELDVKR